MILLVKKKGRSRIFDIFLITSLLVNILIPYQYHLHHIYNYDSLSHDHIVDFHLLTDSLPDDDHSDKDKQDLKTRLDVITKQNIDTGKYIISLVFLFTQSNFNFSIFNRLRHPTHDSFIRYYSYGLAPPLRAPPVL